MNNTNHIDDKAAISGRKQGIISLVIITATVLAGLIFHRQLDALAQKSILPCALLVFAGLRCPLCGGTRCVRALIQLDIFSAFYYNPLVTVVAGICLYMYIRLVISCCRKKYVPYRPEIGEKGMWVVLGIVILFFIVRNLPFYQLYLY